LDKQNPNLGKASQLNQESLFSMNADPKVWYMVQGTITSEFNKER